MNKKRIIFITALLALLIPSLNWVSASSGILNGSKKASKLLPIKKVTLHIDFEFTNELIFDYEAEEELYLYNYIENSESEKSRKSENENEEVIVIIKRLNEETGEYSFYGTRQGSYNVEFKDILSGTYEITALVNGEEFEKVLTINSNNEEDVFTDTLYLKKKSTY